MELRGIDQSWLEGYHYRGEGNANLVVALPTLRSVLRFRKAHDDGRRRVQLEWRFKDLASRCLGPFVVEPEFINCHPRDIPDWQEKVEAHRPARRRHKTSYDGFAMRLPDYAVLPDHLGGQSSDSPTFCVEIKPKQASLPEAERLIYQQCRYCRNQVYKLDNKTILRPSRYCPCDLFSGDRSRLRRAIHAFIESPQNNFIVFKNGSYAWGEGCERGELEQLLSEWFGDDSTADSPRHLEDLNYLVQEALLREFPRDPNATSSAVHPIRDSPAVTVQASSNHTHPNTDSQEHKKICKFPNDNNLPRSSVLGKIYQMQQLHRTSLDVVYDIYSKHSNVLNEEIVYFATPEEFQGGTELNFEHIQILRNYMLFTTARDCSVLLAFRKLDIASVRNVPGNHIIRLPGRGSYFSFSVGITDVDPKSLERIEKHRQRAICDLNSMPGS